MTHKNKWEAITRKGKNIENFIISLVAIGLVFSKKAKLTPSQLVCSGYLQIAGNRYFPKAELDKHAAKLKRLLNHNPEVLLQEYRYFQKLLGEMKSFANKIPERNFEELDFIKFLQKWSSHFNKTIQYDYNYNLINQDLSEIILNALERNKVKDKFFVFEILSQAKKPSVIQQEKLEFLNFLKEVKSTKLKLNSQRIQEFITNHLKKYRYMGMFYFSGQPWTEKYLLKRLKSLLNHDNSDELKRLQRVKEADLATKRLIQKYKFTLSEKKLITLIKEMTYSINLFDEVYNYYTYKSQPFLHYLAKRIGLTYNELIEMSFFELIELLKSNKKATIGFREVLKKRKQDSALIAQKGRIKILIGSKVKEFYKKEFSGEKVAQLAEFKGQSACPGKVRGKVVIFKAVADISKVKKGNIMVAVATVPSFVPAMEKAVGIVTEMGGLLSHAAIVSRELNIPCIVGVDNVTKILKDGNQVEVDATKGIVKKIK